MTVQGKFNMDEKNQEAYILQLLQGQVRLEEKQEAILNNQERENIRITKVETRLDVTESGQTQMKEDISYIKANLTSILASRMPWTQVATGIAALTAIGIALFK